MADKQRGRGSTQNRGGRGRGGTGGARGAVPLGLPPDPEPPARRIEQSDFPALGAPQAAPRPTPNAPRGAAWGRTETVVASAATSAQLPVTSGVPKSSEPSTSRASASHTVSLEKSVSALTVGDGAKPVSTRGQGDAGSSKPSSSKSTSASAKSAEKKPEGDANALEERDPVTRPSDAKIGFGTRGFPIALKANHYVLRVSKKDQMIYCYSLAIAARCGTRDLPEPLKPAIKRHIMNEFRRQNPRQVLGRGQGGEIAFNKADEIFVGFLLANITDQEEVVFEFATTMEQLGDPRMYDCKVTLKLIRQERMDNYLQVFKTGNLSDRKAEDYIRPVDTILRQAMLVTQRAVEIGRSLYIPAETEILQHGRLAISKLFVSVRPSTAMNGLITLFLTSGSAFYKEQPLLWFLRDNNPSLVVPQRADPNFVLEEGFVEWLNANEVRGLKVEVPTLDAQTQKEYQKTYAIKQICRESVAVKKFDLDNKKISVLDYHRNLGRAILFPRLQVVEMMNGSFIPMELCKIKKHQQLLDRVAPMVAEEMVTLYSRPAPERMRHIQQNREASITTNNPVMQSFSLELSPNMVAFNGRVLPAPVLSQKGLRIPVNDGSWKCDFEKVENAKSLNKWVLFYVDCYPIRDLVVTFKKTGQQMGIGVSDPQNGDGTKIRRNELKTAVSKLDAKSLDLAVFIEDRQGRKSDLHDEIKRVCESGSAVQKLRTQFISRSTASRPGNIANILRKINVKLGGINFRFERPRFLANIKTMVIGADVTHPKGAGLRKRPSVAAVVANTDDAFLQYKAVLDPQVGDHGKLKELIENFGDIMLKLFAAYGDVPPERIYYYRDGVSEGQYKQVLAYEYAALVDAYKKKYGKEAKITFIVVTKRHQTRLACQNDRDAPKGKGANVPAGTVADKDLCSNLTFDWYMASQHGIQGTTRPAHYIVMIDQNCSTADQLQELSYALAHAFQRTTRSVSLPTPVYYAHLAAERAKEILGPSEYPKLADDSPSAVQAELRKIREFLTISVDGMYWV